MSKKVVKKSTQLRRDITQERVAYPFLMPVELYSRIKNEAMTIWNATGVRTHMSNVIRKRLERDFKEHPHS